MKRILMLTDFSDASVNAMHFAQELWQGEECQFLILHIHNVHSYTSDDLVSSSSSSNLYQTLIREPKQRLKSLIETFKIKYHNSRHQFKSLVDVDSFLEAINQVLKSKGIDYVVLGSNGASNAKEVVFGSHALILMRQLNCNTLVIPQDYPFKPIKDILLVLEEEDALSKSILNELMYLKGLTNSSLDIIRVLGEYKSLNDESALQSMFDKDDFRYHQILEVPLAYAVDTFVQTNDVDLMLMPGNFTSFLKRLTGPAQKTEVTKLYKLPLLSFKT